jgi:glycosyltransferase involved in cell wall biosynthesis
MAEFTKCSLGIVTESIGLRSETFVLRHVEQLYPGRTAVVTNACAESFCDRSAQGIPVLQLQQLPLMGRAADELVRLLFAQSGFRGEHRVRSFLRAHGVKIILGEFLDYSHKFIRLALKMGIRFYAHAHGIDISARLRDLGWRTRYLEYRNTAGIITVSRESADRLVALGLPAAQIHVIPCGVEAPNSLPARQNQEPIRLLAVGRMVSKKAPVLLLDAFRRASERVRNIHLDYVGDGPLMPAARHFVQAFELDRVVTLHGGRSHHEVLALMNTADLFLQHSIIDPDTGDMEGLPVAILEAMARSLPVISTLHAGIPEAVIDGESGYLVPEGNTMAMAERVVTLVREPELRRRMGAAARARVCELFSWDREKAHLVQLLGLVGD